MHIGLGSGDCYIRVIHITQNCRVLMTVLLEYNTYNLLIKYKFIGGSATQCQDSRFVKSC